MATLRDIRTRVKGVKSTQKITKAMKMVAAAKLRRSQEAITNAKPYALKIYSLLSSLITEDDRATNPLLVERPVKSVLIVAIAADRGLCGAFNTNLLRETNRVIAEQQANGVTPLLYCVGKKSVDHFKKKPFELYGQVTGIFGKLKHEDANSIAQNIISGYTSGKFDKVILIYNEFRSVISQKVVTEQYLPVALKDDAVATAKEVPFIYEPGQKEIFNVILPRAVVSKMWKALLDSNAAEFGARMTAMDNASNNAKEMIRVLNLKYNKERQAAITKEILEIVSGANALKSS